MENNNTLPNSKTSPEKGKLSLDEHLEEIGDNVTNSNEKENNIDPIDFWKDPFAFWTPEKRSDLTPPMGWGNSLAAYLAEHPKLPLFNEDPPTITQITSGKIFAHSMKNEKLILGLRPRKEYDYLLETYDKIGLLPTQNISLVVAPPKSGKTTFISILIASVLGCGRKYGRHALNKKSKVLHIDTEQGEPDQQKNMQYIFDMCKEEKMSEEVFSKRYRSLHARQIRGKELMERIEVEIIKYAPDLVVIDGIAQMADNIMEQPEAARINDQLQSLAEGYKCNIMCVIHTPKIKRNEDDMDLYLPKGALGSMLFQGAYDIFTCMKKNEGQATSEQYFVVKHIGRGEETPKMLFARDPANNGRPKPYYEIKTGDKTQSIINAIKQIFSDNRNETLTKTNLIKQLSQKLGKGFSEKQIQNIWKENETTIEKDLYINDLGNKILIKLKTPDDPEEQVFEPIAEPDQQTEEAPF